MWKKLLMQFITFVDIRCSIQIILYSEHYLFRFSKLVGTDTIVIVLNRKLRRVIPVVKREQLENRFRDKIPTVFFSNGLNCLKHCFNYLIL